MNSCACKIPTTDPGLSYRIFNPKSINHSSKYEQEIMLELNTIQLPKIASLLVLKVSQEYTMV